MRSPVKSFHYVATLGSSDIKPGEVSVLADCLSDDPRDAELAGSAPILRFLDDRLVLLPAPGSKSELKWCAFAVGDLVRCFGRPGDRVLVSRDTSDGLAVIVYRNGRLLAAAGALICANTGPGIEMRRPQRPPDDRIQVEVFGQMAIMRSRESAVLGNYDVYVDFIAEFNKYGYPSESLSIAVRDEPTVVNAARRAAVLMTARSDDPLCGERRDGTMIKRRFFIG